MDRGRVEQMELGPVCEHEADGLSTPDPERVQARGEPAHERRVLPKRVAQAVVDRAQGDLVRVLAGRQLEGLTHGLRVKRPRALAARP